MLIPTQSLGSIKGLTGSWKKEGIHCPLFLRLIDANPQQQEETPPLRILSKEETKASVIEEIQNLLNTYVPISITKYQLLMRNPKTLGYPELYGLPDFSNVDPTDQASWPFYANLIQQAILYYEPRLIKTSVEITSFIKNTQTLVASLSGSLVLGDVTEPFTFTVSLTHK